MPRKCPRQLYRYVYEAVSKFLSDKYLHVCIVFADVIRVQTSVSKRKSKIETYQRTNFIRKSKGKYNIFDTGTQQFGK